MRRAEYLKAQAAGRARVKRKPAAPARESALVRLQRERPEMFKRGYFLEPVLRWWPGWKPAGELNTRSSAQSRAATAAREAGMNSSDPWMRMVAKGDLDAMGATVRR